MYRLTLPDTPPDVTRPDPAVVVSGDPEFRTWNLETDGGLYCGFWQSTPGSWTMSYTEWEFCHILEGVSIITDADGQTMTVRAGDTFVLRPGYSGTWEVVETTLKQYVIRL
jgi:uncharacterized cupin superfamily protein